MKNPLTIITGGAQGIGRAAAAHFINAGHKVVIFDFDQEALNEVKFENADSNNCIKLLCDVAYEIQVKESLEKAKSEFGQINNLVNNAAVSINKKINDLSLEEWNRVIGTNLTGMFLMVKHSLELFENGTGKIVNICSTRAFQSEADTEAYSASKGGVYSLTHSLAVSLGPKIKVNSISPGWIDVTKLKKENNIENVTLSEEDHSQHPAGRVGTADDIVQMIDYLLSEKAAFITGQNFTIDGGMTTKMIYK